MMAKIFGANFRTTLVGIVGAGLAAYADGAFTDPADWKKWLLPVAFAVLGYLAKDRQVVGGSVQQTMSGAVADPGTQTLVDETVKSSIASGDTSVTPEQKAAVQT